MELSSHVLEPRRELNLRLLVDSIPAPVAVMTPSGEVESVNKPNLEYFGKTFEDLKKWGTSDAVHPDDLPHAIEIWMEAIQTGQPYDVKQRLRRFDGVYRWFGVHGFPLRDPDGRILNWCVLLTDIDDRERVEQALRVVVETPLTPSLVRTRAVRFNLPILPPRESLVMTRLN